ncbi:MAG: hypothetical protein R3A52_15440 [Polyangiales bacterium]
MNPPRARTLALALALGWGALVVGGLAALDRYALTPGPVAAARVERVSDASLRAPDGRLALHVFAHPRCPCTRATLSELERLMARVGDRVAVTVWFRADDDAWRETATARRALAIPGLRVEADPRGARAARAGARTSGEVVAVDASGNVRFRGGITPARGHEGDNEGRRALEALARSITTPSPAGRSLVAHAYGCALHDPSSRTR